MLIVDHFDPTFVQRKIIRHEFIRQIFLQPFGIMVRSDPENIQPLNIHEILNVKHNIFDQCDRLKL